MSKQLPWFRFHVSALSNRKVQALPAELFKGWVNMLCVARSNGGVLPSLEDTAFAMRMPEAECAALLKSLEHRKFLDREGDSLKPHDFKDWQFESDVSTPRVRKFRERRKQEQRNVSETAPDTESETDTETDQNQSERDAPARVSILLPEDWQPSPAAFARARDLGLSGDDITKMLLRFGPHYRARGEKRADWDEQFLAWCADEARKLDRSPPRPPKPAQPEGPIDPQWVPIKQHLLPIVGEDVFTSWFKNAVVVSIDGEELVLGAASKFIVSHWTNNLFDKIGDAITAAYPQVKTFRFVVAQQSERKP